MAGNTRKSLLNNGPSKFFNLKPESKEEELTDVTLADKTKNMKMLVMKKKEEIKRKDFLKDKTDINGDIKQIMKENKKKDNTKEKNMIEVIKKVFKDMAKIMKEDRKQSMMINMDLEADYD